MRLRTVYSRREKHACSHSRDTLMRREISLFTYSIATSSVDTRSKCLCNHRRPKNTVVRRHALFQFQREMKSTHCCFARTICCIMCFPGRVPPLASALHGRFKFTGGTNRWALRFFQKRIRQRAVLVAVYLPLRFTGCSAPGPPHT